MTGNSFTTVACAATSAIVLAAPTRSPPLRFDAAVEKTGERDDTLWPTHVLLKQLDHVRAACYVFGRCVITSGLRADRHSGGKILGTFKREGMHCSTSFHRTGDASGILNPRHEFV